MGLFGDVASAKGFTAAQLENYWAANTFLQMAFDGKPIEEQNRAAANLVNMGLERKDFQAMAHQFLRMKFADQKDWQCLQRMGLSIEQTTTWLRAPSVDALDGHQERSVSRQSLLEDWKLAEERAKAIRKQGLHSKTIGVGALLSVGVAVTTVAFSGLGYGLNHSSLKQTGVAFFKFAQDAWMPEQLDIAGWGKNILTVGSVVAAALGLNALKASGEKHVADGKRVNLRDKLSREHFQDRELMDQLHAIPKPFTPLLSHLGAEDLVLFLKGDDPLRASILRTDPPDHSQRHQFACLSSKWAARWMKQLDVSLLDWDNPRSDTGSQVLLSQLRKERHQRLQSHEESPSSPAPLRSPVV